MKLVRLSNGGIAVVDDEDYWVVSNFKWCRHDCKGGLTYAIRTTTDTPREMHRAIVGADNGRFAGRKLQVHHRDGNGLNNCKSNLRITLAGQHQADHRTGKESSSLGCEVF